MKNHPLLKTLLAPHGLFSRGDLRVRLLRVIIAPILILALLLGVLLWRINHLLELNQWVNHSNEVIAVGNASLLQVVNLETGLRGFLLSSNPEFLEPHRDAVMTLDEGFTRWKALVADNPAQSDRVMQIEGMVGQWMQWAAPLTRARTPAEIQRARASVKRGFGLETMGKIRAEFEDFIQSEEKLRNDRTREAEGQTRYSIALSLAVALILGLLVSFAVANELIRLSASFSTALREAEEAKKRIEENNAELEAKIQLRTADLTAVNAELESFCYSVSHDLRAPLRGIDGFSLALQEDYGSSLDEVARKQLRFVREGVQRMGRLIDDLLNLSRVSRVELRKEPTDLAALVRETFDRLQQADPARKVELRCLDQAIASGDSGLLSVVIENLVSNAWKFSGHAGAAVIEFGVDQTERGRAYFVRDNGAGFDMQYAGKLFGAFQRLHSAKEFPGTGVGLATVKRVVHRHGGEVWAESKIGHGATFYFTIA